MKIDIIERVRKSSRTRVSCVLGSETSLDHGIVAVFVVSVRLR
jgi:hypothetical protein